MAQFVETPPAPSAEPIPAGPSWEQPLDPAAVQEWQQAAAIDKQVIKDREAAKAAGTFVDVVDSDLGRAALPFYQSEYRRDLSERGRSPVPQAYRDFYEAKRAQTRGYVQELRKRLQDVPDWDNLGEAEKSAIGVGRSLYYRNSLDRSTETLALLNDLLPASERDDPQALRNWLATPLSVNVSVLPSQPLRQPQVWQQARQRRVA